MAIVRWFVCILLLLFVMHSIPEHFTDGLPLLSYRVSIPKYRYRIYMNDHDVDLTPLLKDIYNITTTNVKAGADAYVDDVFFYSKEHMALTILPFEKHLVFIKEKDPFGYETIHNLIQRKPIIGYQDERSHVLAKVILAANNIDIKNVTFIETTEWSKVGCMAMYGLWKDLAKKVDTIALDFITYETTDIHLLKLWIPFAKLKDEDMQVHFPNYKDRFPVKQCLALDMLIATNSETHSLFSQEIHTLIQATSCVDKNNYYHQYFHFASTNTKYMKKYNNYIQSRNDLSILEQFDTDFVLVATHPVDGFFDAHLSVLYMFHDAINNIKLMKGQRVRLPLQNREEENGLYDVTDIQRGVVLRLVDPQPLKKDSPTDTRYRCEGDPQTISKELCESVDDISGITKQKKGEWDRPCEKNIECPFYQANKNYRNYRGGCNDGLCEFPLGVIRVSSRKYNPSSKPICHGCPIDNPTCCDQQTNPDYAFTNDEYERMTRYSSS